MANLKNHLSQCSSYTCYACKVNGKTEDDHRFKSDFELENHWRTTHADHVGGLCFDEMLTDFTDGRNGSFSDNSDDKETNVLADISRKYH